MSSRPSSRVRFDEESIRTAAVDMAASRGRPPPVDSRSFFIRDKEEVVDSGHSASHAPDGNPIQEAKISETQPGGSDEYWLSLAAGDIEDDNEKHNYDTDEKADDTLDDDAYLEQFNKRWGTPKADDDDDDVEEKWTTAQPIWRKGQ